MWVWRVPGAEGSGCGWEPQEVLTAHLVQHRSSTSSHLNFLPTCVLSTPPPFHRHRGNMTAAALLEFVADLVGLPPIPPVDLSNFVSTYARCCCMGASEDDLPYLLWTPCKHLPCFSVLRCRTCCCSALTQPRSLRLPSQAVAAR